jgi:hypothetical protein
MPKLVPIVLALIVVLAGGASADLLTLEQFEQIAACKPDFDKYCGGQTPSARIVGIGCFMNGPVSESCKKALDDFDKKRPEGTPGTKN